MTVVLTDEDVITLNVFLDCLVQKEISNEIKKLLNNKIIKDDSIQNKTTSAD